MPPFAMTIPYQLTLFYQIATQGRCAEYKKQDLRLKQFQNFIGDRY